MSDDQTNEGRDIADLLPFYATGTLAERDRARVDAALGSEPALRHELDLILEEREETIATNEALGTPSRAARDRFFALLETAPSAAPKRFDVVGWVASRLAPLQPRTLAWSAALALVVVALQGGTIGIVLTHLTTPKAGFETASVAPSRTTEGKTEGPTVIVAFAPDARAADIVKLLTEVDASILAGPMPGGLFQLRVGSNATKITDKTASLDAIVAKLKSQPSLVRFAAPGGGAD